MRQASGRISAVLGLLGLTAMAACSPTIDSNGHVFRGGELEQLVPGGQTRDGVLALLGTPSSKAPFNEDIWYYIGEKNEHLAFFGPELLERQIVVVRFDDAGFIESTEVLTEEDRNQVALVERETPTAGHELTFVEQLIGNIGRFNRDSAGSQ